MQQRNSDPIDAGSNSQTSDQDFISSLLYTLALVESPTEEAFDKFTRLVTRALDVPVALVSFVEEERDRQVFKSQIGLDPEWAEQGETPLSHSFCQYVKRDNRPLIIEDAPSDSRVCGNLAIPELGVRAYLGFPVHGPNGHPLGALCAINTVSHHWCTEDVSIMKDLASCVTDQINLRAALCQSHGLEEKRFAGCFQSR